MCRKLLSPSLWHRVHCGRVHDVNATIHLKEAEAALFVSKHLVRGKNDGQGKRYLILGDSMTLSYVLGKGRAGNPQLLAIARKWACISMADALLLVYRWISSEYNVADRDSRRWEENHILCETADRPSGPDLKPMIGELDAPLSPLVEDASPWIEFCSQQIPKTWRQNPKTRRDQGIPTHRLVRWENADKWRNTNGPRKNGAERTNLSAGSAYLPHDPSESSGVERVHGPSPPQEQRSRARNHGQLPEGIHGFRVVCSGATWPTFVLASWQRCEKGISWRQTDQRVRRDVFLLLFERKKVASPAKLTLSTDSVILDRPDLLWMDRLWQALIVGRPEHARLIPMDQNEIAREVKTIFEELGCSKLGVVAYSLRHGGPSWDFMKKFRSLDEIQQRGRWRSPTSVLRYQEASKLLSAMQLIEPRQAEFGRYCEAPPPWEVDLSLDWTSMFQ